MKNTDNTNNEISKSGTYKNKKDAQRNMNAAKNQGDIRNVTNQGDIRNVTNKDARGSNITNSDY